MIRRRNLRLVSNVRFPNVGKQNTSYLEWNPNDGIHYILELKVDNKIATAGLSGTILIFDLNSAGVTTVMSKYILQKLTLF